MEFVIEARELCKQYPGWKGSSLQKRLPAVSGLNLAIPKGQLYSLVGPDGAGKTTTLRILSTVLEQTSGSAHIMGYDVRSEPEKARRHIGYMPQNFSLYPDLSVVENLNFFADIHQIPAQRRKARIEEMLAFTRLERFVTRRAGALSGGMKKKLALACALVHDPAVLLLDEPSTGVDPVSRRELWVILADVVHQGVTVLVSTPYMDEAERCHRVGILYDGHILVDGTPEELTTRLPFEIIETKAKPRKAMRQIVSEVEGILEWRPVGDRLRMSVANHNGDVERVMDVLAARYQEAALDVRLLRRSKPSMEDVFVHLVDEQRRAK
jgi:ABC-2 type transport system ATP-binding protein